MADIDLNFHVLKEKFESTVTVGALWICDSGSPERHQEALSVLTELKLDMRDRGYAVVSLPWQDGIVDLEGEKIIQRQGGNLVLYIAADEFDFDVETLETELAVFVRYPIIKGEPEP